MADIDRIRKRTDNRNQRIVTELAKQYKDIDKLLAEIEERGKLIDTLATENEKFRGLLREVKWLEDDPDAPECDLARRIQQALEES